MKAVANVLIVIAISATLALPAAALGQEARKEALCSSSVDASLGNREDTVSRLRRLLDDSRFDEFEKDAACLLGTEQVFTSGYSAASAVYLTFRRLFSNSETREDAIASLRDWQSRHPDSVALEFARLRLRYDLA